MLGRQGTSDGPGMATADGGRNLVATSVRAAGRVLHRGRPHTLFAFPPLTCTVAPDGSASPCSRRIPIRRHERFTAYSIGSLRWHRSERNSDAAWLGTQLRGPPRSIDWSGWPSATGSSGDRSADQRLSPGTDPRRARTSRTLVSTSHVTGEQIPGTPLQPTCLTVSRL